MTVWFIYPKQILIDTFYKLKYEALNAGLIINNNKTKYLYCTRKTIQPTYINTGEEQLFKQINSFNYSYLGTMVNTDNSIEEEIKERTAAGNRSYRVRKKLFTLNEYLKTSKYNFITR
jgi:hypothetical protein